MRTVSFEANNLYDEYLDRLLKFFSSKQVIMTENAKNLLLLALQSQENEQKMSSREVIRRLNKLKPEEIVEYYLSTYKSKTMTFNLAFHVISDLGLFVKFPWTPSSP